MLDELGVQLFNPLSLFVQHWQQRVNVPKL